MVLGEEEGLLPFFLLLAGKTRWYPRVIKPPSPLMGRSLLFLDLPFLTCRMGVRERPKENVQGGSRVQTSAPRRFCYFSVENDVTTGKQQRRL